MARLFFCLLLAAAAFTPQPALADTDPVAKAIEACRAAYDADDMTAAAPCFAAIAANHPKHRMAPFAAEMHLDALSRQQDTDALSAALALYLKGPLASDDALARRLRKVEEALAFRGCDGSSRDKKHTQAAKCFLDFSARYPTSEHADKALYNAAIHYEEAKETAKAIQLHQRISHHYPDSRLAAESAFIVAMALANKGSDKEAAEAFERFATRHRTHPEASSALLNAIALRGKLGDKAAAIEDCALFTKLYPRSERAPDIALHLGKLYGEAGRPDDAVRTYTAFLKMHGRRAPALNVVAHAAIGRALWDKGRHKKATEAYEQALKTYHRLRNQDDPHKAQDAAGEAQFMLADAMSRRIPKLKGALPISKLSQALTARIEALTEVERAYQKAIEVKSPAWSTAALSRLGDLYMDFAEEIRRIPPPKGLDGAQRDAFTGALEDHIRPIEDKALQAYSMCSKIADQTGIDNSYVKHARDARCKIEGCP